MPGQTSKSVRSIGVLTGGGDVPGLNAAIKALVYRAEPENIRVTGLRSGWEGITFLDRSRRKEDLIFHSEDPSMWQGRYLMPFTRLKMSSVKNGMHGVLAAHREGKFVYTDIPGKDLPARRVNPEDYHETRYRPRFEHIMGPYRPQERILSSSS